MTFDNVILQTTSTTTTTTVVVLGVGVLILAWLVCAILILGGKMTKRNWLFSSGIIAAGVMTVATPLVYYIEETLRLGMYEASVKDWLIVAAISTLGGGMITIGLQRLTRQTHSQ